MVLLLAFLAGYIAANSGSAASGRATCRLAGHTQAPRAPRHSTSIPGDGGQLADDHLPSPGLPKLPKRQLLEVFLARNGKIYRAVRQASSSRAKAGTVSVKLNAPYDLRSGDAWVVTRQLRGRHTAGPGRPQAAQRLGALVPHLAEEPLEALLGRVVDERHRRRDVRVHGCDLATHLVRDRAIGGMPSRPERSSIRWSASRASSSST